MIKVRVRVLFVCGLAALALTCASCADPNPSPSQAASASPKTSSAAPIPSATLSPDVPETVAEYLASQGIEVSGRPDFEGKGAADQYAGQYLMIDGERTSGVTAQFYADWRLPSLALECDPTCSQGPTTIRTDGTTPQNSWNQTMVVHGHDSNQGLEGTRVIERASSGGRFAGQSIDDVAGSLRSGALSPKDVPIDVIVRDGNSLILNTRSSQALIRAGVPRSSWNVIDRTGQAAYESRLTGQLTRNGLSSYGTELP